MIKQVTVITEKQQLPLNDANVAALRKLKSLAPDISFQGWVLDERKAFRQVVIDPKLSLEVTVMPGNLTEGSERIC